MERRLFGQYKLFKDEPETEALKADYISKAVDELLHDMTGNGIIPDWETMQIIVKEGFDIIGGPDWYEEEKEGYKGPYVGWAMTVGIKFYSENYPENILYGVITRKGCDNVMDGSFRLPLVEGKCPPVYDSEKGKWYYPEPDTEYIDPEICETEKYKVEDKEEYYGYPTICKACGTEFQAYQGGEQIRNYCPGCGRKLV